MDTYSDSTDRSPAEYVLFALGFIGFGTAAAGVVLSQPMVAVSGAILFLLVVAAFRSRDEESYPNRS